MQNWDSVALRTVSEDFSADVSLTLYGGMSAKGQALFSQRFDNVPIYSSANSYYDSLEAFSQAMVSGNDSLDVMTLYANQSMFTAMRDKGYCADLSGYPELVAAVQRMHPCFQDIVTKDGKIYGIPVEAYSSGWFVDNTVMETYGLTEGDLPTNLLDFFSFVNEWNDKAGEEDLDVVLLDDGWKDSIFYEVLQKYIEWCQYQGKDLSFDTPEFRAVMRGFEQTRTDNLGENNYDEESYTPALLSPYYTVIGNFNLKERYASFVPMALTPDTEPVYGATVTVMCINPRTKNMDMAVNLLLCALEGMEENEKHVLFADAIEPVENEYLESEMARGKKYIADLEAELAKETDEDIRQGLQEAIDAEKAWMESYVVDYRYTISPEGIEMYQNMIVPHMFASAPNPIFNYADSSSSELRSLCDRYLDKQISLDQFIKEADNKLMMIRLENN